MGLVFHAPCSFVFFPHPTPFFALDLPCRLVAAAYTLLGTGFTCFFLLLFSGITTVMSFIIYGHMKVGTQFEGPWASKQRGST
jgi:hypothetical protein